MKCLILLSLLMASTAWGIQKKLITVKIKQEESNLVTVKVTDQHFSRQSETNPIEKGTNAKFYQALYRALSQLPISKDSPTMCPRNYIQIEYYQDSKLKKIFSCFENKRDRKKFYQLGLRVL